MVKNIHLFRINTMQPTAMTVHAHALSLQLVSWCLVHLSPLTGARGGRKKGHQTGLLYSYLTANTPTSQIFRNGAQQASPLVRPVSYPESMPLAPLYPPVLAKGTRASTLMRFSPAPSTSLTVTVTYYIKGDAGDVRARETHLGPWFRIIEIDITAIN